MFYCYRCYLIRILFKVLFWEYYLSYFIIFRYCFSDCDNLLLFYVWPYCDICWHRELANIISLNIEMDLFFWNIKTKQITQKKANQEANHDCIRDLVEAVIARVCSSVTVPGYCTHLLLRVTSWAMNYRQQEKKIGWMRHVLTTLSVLICVSTNDEYLSLLCFTSTFSLAILNLPCGFLSLGEEWKTLECSSVEVKSIIRNTKLFKCKISWLYDL